MNKPLRQYLMKYLSGDPVPFHTPGHKGRLFMEGITGKIGEFPARPESNLLFRADVPDDVCGFPGVLRESEEEASKIFGTLRTFYLVNGSTAGIHTMFGSVLKPGDKILIGRNLHSSVVSALVLTGAVPRYIPVETDSDGFQLNVLPVSVKKAIEENPDAVAVFITSPSYYGVCPDILEISNIVHSAGMILMADEAWGAHLPFADGFPPSALEAGADMVVQGAHKTLPVLTGSALLHLNSAAVDPEKVKTTLNLNETTSPNMLFYLFLEAALDFMDSKGRTLLKETAENVKHIRKLLREKASLLRPAFTFDDSRDKAENNKQEKPPFLFDPLKLLIRTNYGKTGITGYETAGEIIERFSIIPEMADILSVLFIFTGFEEDGDEKKLLNALTTISEEKERQLDEIEKTILVDPDISSIKTIPVMDVLPREAFFAESRLIPLEESEGWTAKSLMVPYPPGIPILIPGEVITDEIIEYQQIIISMGGIVRGIIFEKDIPYVEVIA